MTEHQVHEPVTFPCGCCIEQTGIYSIKITACTARCSVALRFRRWAKDEKLKVKYRVARKR